MRTLAVEPLLPAAFAPFGTVVQVPPEAERTVFPQALTNLRPEARATLSAARIAPLDLPFTANVMERHRFSTQTFLPLDVARYVVVVAPHAADGLPDMRHARAFLAGSHTGVSYAADCWHHSLIVLDRPGSFAVLMWRDGTEADMETVTFDERVQIVP